VAGWVAGGRLKPIDILGMGIFCKNPKKTKKKRERYTLPYEIDLCANLMILVRFGVSICAHNIVKSYFKF
jgi:hypothetical protein